MKNILGYVSSPIYTCNECGCIFTADDKEIKTINLNCKKLNYIDCPNCECMCHNGYMLELGYPPFEFKCIDLIEHADLQN